MDRVTPGQVVALTPDLVDPLMRGPEGRVIPELAGRAITGREDLAMRDQEGRCTRGPVGPHMMDLVVLHSLDPEVHVMRDLADHVTQAPGELAGRVRLFVDETQRARDVKIMNKLIFLMLLGVMSITSAAAEWVEVGRNDTFATFVDPSTIRKKGDIVKLWSLQDLKTAEVVVNDKPYLSAVGQEEYDCKEEQERTLALRFYAENMGRGKVVFTGDNPGNWSPITPQTIGEMLWEFACGKK